MVAVVAGTLGTVVMSAPVAKADTIHLDNGLTVDMGVEGEDGSRRIFVTADGDTDTHINVRSTGHAQFERDLEKRVASFIVNREQTEVAIQPCNVSDFSAFGSFCGAFSTFYPYGSAASSPAPGASAKPGAAPTVTGSSISSMIGSRRLTVTDNSGVASRCTYTSRIDSATFDLPANGTVNDVIVAMAAESGTVTCDNGTSVTVTF